MGKLDLGEAEFLFECKALAAAGLRVYRFRGHESLSQPFEFLIDLVSRRANLDIEAPIGEPACLTLRGRAPDGSRYSRHIHGIIERFIHLGTGKHSSRYQARLIPSVGLLQFTRNCRIFQKQSVTQVTQQVLKDDKIKSDCISVMLHGSYSPRDYCVQYQESDLHFVQRLWEEEGIFFFFEGDKSHGTLVLGDGRHAFAELPMYGAAFLRDQPHLYEEGLFELHAESSLRPGATLFRDFMFKQPTLDLESRAEAEKFSDLSIYHFPGEYVDPEMGRRLAKIRLEEIQCQKTRYYGRGNIRAAQPGCTFTLAGDRRDDGNQEYLIVAVEHAGAQPQALGEEASGGDSTTYQNSLECIPAKVPYRPARVTPAPCIAGVQTAHVVGPPGEEIHCDEHGRVKVQFHWDRHGRRDDNSSCWIRVSQPWGGAGQGGMFIPRVGQEVVVHFLEGDPDRPLIIGRVYNGENPVPHALPASKNISTIRSASTPGGGGFNEIKFDDTKDKEEIFIHAQFDMNEVVEHNHTTTVHSDQRNTVDGNHTETVKKNHKLTVTEGDQRITVKTGKRDTTIQKDDTLTVHGSQTLQVDGSRRHSISQGETVSIGGSQTATIGGAHSQSVALASADNIGLAKSLSVGAAYAVTVGAGHMLSVGGAMMMNVGAVLMQSVGLVHKLTAGKKWQLDVGAAKAMFRSSGKIQLQGGSSKIEMQPGKITLDSGGGAQIVLEGPKIKIAATEIDINGSAKIDIKAPLINSESSGVTTIKGAMVKINT